MSSCLIINSGSASPEKQAHWLPNSKVFKDTFIAIKRELGSGYPNLTQDIDAGLNSMVNYLDLTQWDSQAITVLFWAIRQVVSPFIHDLTKFETEELGWSFSAIADLQILVYLDDRFIDKNPVFIQGGRIILDTNDTWVQSGWVFDLALSHFLSRFARPNYHTKRNNLPLAQDTQTAFSTRSLNLHKISDSNKEAIFHALDGLNQDYGQRKVSSPYSLTFKELYGNAIANLYQRFELVNKARIGNWLSDDPQDSGSITTE